MICRDSLKLIGGDSTKGASGPVSAITTRRLCFITCFGDHADASRFEVEAEQVAVVAAADYYFLTNFEIDQLQIATNVAALQMNYLKELARLYLKVQVEKLARQHLQVQVQAEEESTLH